MDNPSRNFSLRTFDDAMGATCISGPITPMESPICSPLIFSSTTLADDLLQLAETPSTSVFEPESPPLATLPSPCFPHSIPLDRSPDSPLDVFATAETFYTPQGIGEDVPLQESPLLFRSNPSPVIPSVGAVNPTATAYPSLTGSELSELTACSLACLGSPITPSVASVILSSGGYCSSGIFQFCRVTAQGVQGILHQSFRRPSLNIAHIKL